jgi:iron complex outermembrane recepter protein
VKILGDVVSNACRDRKVKIAVKAALLSASYVAIGIASTEVNAQAREQTASQLPAIQVDAPRPAQRKRAVSRSNSTASRSSVVRSEKPEVPVADRPGGFNSTAQLGAPPPAFAGGQVATGGKVGLLGNRSVFDTPYSSTSYTGQQIENTQSGSLVDLAIADPSIKAASSRGSFFDQIQIRGFNTITGDSLFDGMAGILPDQTYSASFSDRVEILKGPAVFLTGIALGGNIAGTVNFVPKRATDDPITRITGTFASQSLFGTQIDYGRRFGDQKEWGVRVNALYTDGDTVARGQEHQVGAAQVSTDYRGERFRASLDIGYQNPHDTSVLSAITPGALTSIPAPPKGDRTFVPPWLFADNENTYGLARAEYDLASNVTLFAAAGGSSRNFDTVQLSPLTVLNTAGDYRARPAHLVSPTDTFSSEAGIRANFLTGPISHKMVIVGDYIEQDKKQQIFISPFLPAGFTIPGNIYQPNNAPEPIFAGPNLGRNFTTVLPSIAVADTLSAFDDRIQLTLGLRNQRIASEVRSAATGLLNDESDKERTSPAISLLVKPVEHLSVYASYIEAFTQGPRAPVGSVNEGEDLSPIVSTSKEVGAKYDFGRLGMSLAFFEIEQPQTFIDATTNIFGFNGSQRNRGIEYFMFGELSPGLRALGGITYIDAKQIATEGHLTDGKTAIGVPATSISMGVDYDIPGVSGLAVNGRVIYTSPQFVTADNSLEIPDWTRLDLGARYSFMWEQTRMTARFNVENVTGEAYWSSASNGFLIFGAPRTYLASLTVDLTPAPSPGQLSRPMWVK